MLGVLPQGIRRLGFGLSSLPSLEYIHLTIKCNTKPTYVGIGIGIAIRFQIGSGHECLIVGFGACFSDNANTATGGDEADEEGADLDLEDRAVVRAV